MTARKLHGIDELRRAVRLFSNCNETFNQQYSAAELLLLADACVRSGWDFTPDEWDDRQLREALGGSAPDWAETAWKDYVPKYLDGSLAPNPNEDFADEVADSLQASGLDVSRRPQ